MKKHNDLVKVIIYKEFMNNGWGNFSNKHNLKILGYLYFK